MADKLAQRIHDIHESSTIRMAKLCRELIAQGHDVVNLSLGEPDFETPEHINKAAIEAIHQGYTHYPPVAGYPDARQAIVEKLKRDNGLTYQPSQTLISTGAKQSIINVILCLLGKGDEIIIPGPYWVTYPEMVKLSEATTVFVHAGVENDYKITPEQLEKAITPRTKAFVFSSPCNPTGSVYSMDELKALAKVFARHPQIMIISDEIYEYINFRGRHVSFAQIPEMYDRTVVINGLSKGFAMTGWRIGYMAGPEWLVKACEKLQGQFTSAACSISERATIAALTGDMTPTHKMCEAFRDRRELLLKKMGEIEGMKFSVPEGAFYLFPDVSYYFGKSYKDHKIKGAEDLCMYLLDEAKVSLVAGDGFGAPNCIRISFAASNSDLDKATSRMKEALANLK